MGVSEMGVSDLLDAEALSAFDYLHPPVRDVSAASSEGVYLMADLHGVGAHDLGLAPEVIGKTLLLQLERLVLEDLDE